VACIAKIVRGGSGINETSPSGATFGTILVLVLVLVLVVVVVVVVVIEVILAKRFRA